jgi:hypothetical protein
VQRAAERHSVRTPAERSPTPSLARLERLARLEAQRARAVPVQVLPAVTRCHSPPER